VGVISEPRFMVFVCRAGHLLGMHAAFRASSLSRRLTARLGIERCSLPKSVLPVNRLAKTLCRDRVLDITPEGLECPALGSEREPAGMAPQVFWRGVTLRRG
jgi:hypothetical protein